MIWSVNYFYKNTVVIFFHSAWLISGSSYKHGWSDCQDIFAYVNEEGLLMTLLL